jgi:hypothetical protein
MDKIIHILQKIFNKKISFRDFFSIFIVIVGFFYKKNLPAVYHIVPFELFFVSKLSFCVLVVYRHCINNVEGAIKNTGDGLWSNLLVTSWS